MPERKDPKILIYHRRRGVLLRKQYGAELIDGNNSNVLFVTPEGYNNIGDLLALVDRHFPTLERVGLVRGFKGALTKNY
jgi:hypothetical protein